MSTYGCFQRNAAFLPTSTEDASPVQIGRPSSMTSLGEGLHKISITQKQDRLDKHAIFLYIS